MKIVKFDELDESWVQTGGLWTRCVFMGPKNNPDGPVGVAIKADRDVGDMVAGKRSFNTTTAMTVLSGLVMHDGKWMSPGDMYLSPPNEVSGDLLFGPEGAVIFILFDKRSGMVPSFASDADQANFDKKFRKDVEDVAMGKCEKSVSILPPRAEHMTGRAIVYNTVEEVERYRKETGTEW